MQQKEGYFKGVGNFNLYWRCWIPDGQPKAVILVVHGVSEHIARYDYMADHLVPRGYAVYGLDHQGHGKSQGQRVFVERFQVYVDDLKTFHDMVCRDKPGLKVFMLGQSMGGLIATSYTVQHQQELAGLIVLAPALAFGDSVSGATIVAGRVLSKLAPRMGVKAVGSTYISRDEAVVEAFDKDPLIYHGKLTARLGSEMLATMDRIQQQMPAIQLPLLIMQGSSDKLVSLEGSKLLYEKAASADKTLKIYDGFYHEVFHDPDSGRAFDDLDSWLDSHAQAK
jgi:acylglycerol lipase